MSTIYARERIERWFVNNLLSIMRNWKKLFIILNHKKINEKSENLNFLSVKYFHCPLITYHEVYTSAQMLYMIFR